MFTANNSGHHNLSTFGKHFLMRQMEWNNGNECQLNCWINIKTA